MYVGLHRGETKLILTLPEYVHNGLARLRLLAIRQLSLIAELRNELGGWAARAIVSV